MGSTAGSQGRGGWLSRSLPEGPCPCDCPKVRTSVLTREVTQEPIPRQPRNHLESPRLLEQM